MKVSSPFLMERSMHIVTVAGIRPDFIRLSEIIRRLDASSCEHTLIHTGQHYDDKLSQVFFEELDIREPDYNLLCGGGDHVQQMCKVVPTLLSILSKTVDRRSPHMIMFLGDSNSVLAAPFLKKEGYRIAHIEALMRSHDMRMLEETNRICCDSVSDLLFTYHANYLQYATNLFGDPVVVGNTIVEPTIKHMPKEEQTKSHILIDIHRPENFKDPKRMSRMMEIFEMVQRHNQIPVYFLEFPRTMATLRDFGIDVPKNLTTIPLMGYKKHLNLQFHSKYIISDSGTDQEQPALLNVPVFVPRTHTERPESYIENCSVQFNLDMVSYRKMDSDAQFMRDYMSSDWLKFIVPTSEVITYKLLCSR